MLSFKFMAQNIFIKLNVENMLKNLAINHNTRDVIFL